MTGQAAGGDSIKAWREAAHMAASLTLLQIGEDRKEPRSGQNTSIVGKTRLRCDAVPKVNCKADVAGPKGIPSAANG